MLFSEREGIKSPKEIIQVDSVDEDLLSGLWNALTFCYWSIYDDKKSTYGVSLKRDARMNNLIHNMQFNYFKQPFDNIPNDWKTMRQFLKDYFFNCDWFEVYDLIEFIANNYSYEPVNAEFKKVCNVVLEKEISAYRFVDNRIVNITSQKEIDELEEVLKKTKVFPNANEHLNKGFEFLADRNNPDYRNSIKESISAVEAMCKLIVKDEKATLGKALNKLNETIQIHPALRRGFSNIYGYTNDADGIRHALMNETLLDFEDAKYMFISCSGFINYLIIKLSKSGLQTDMKGD